MVLQLKALLFEPLCLPFKPAAPLTCIPKKQPNNYSILNSQRMKLSNIHVKTVIIKQLKRVNLQNTKSLVYP